MPAAMFQTVFQLWTSKFPLSYNCIGDLTFGETEVPGSERSVVDREFCIKLFAACCRMLCTILKHHRSKTHCCIALLEYSVGSLLNYLETVCTSPVGGEYFGWEVQRVKCDSFLRRMYEEALECFMIRNSWPWKKSDELP
ncbi:hypothetical protein FXO38_32875 [Capsicum annuum]|nr:hypothetical protein FXO37_34943 [Capsicum annuum]KAF3619534.1 hypothetical protein FXO38_32875 [Capsicum annuum]